MYARFVYHDFNCTVFLAFPDCCMFVDDQCYSVKASRLAEKRVEMPACCPSQLVSGLMVVLFLLEVLATSSVNGSKDVTKHALDPNLVGAIRSE